MDNRVQFFINNLGDFVLRHAFSLPFLRLIFTLFITCLGIGTHMSVWAQENTPKLQGDIAFRARSVDFKITIGSYRLTWDISKSPYEIRTKLEPEGFAKLFMKYSLFEVSKGLITDSGLSWQNYEIVKSYGESDSRNRTEIITRLSDTTVKDEDGETIVLSNANPIDFPSLFMELMLQRADKKSWRGELFFSSGHQAIVVNKLGEENIEVPAGHFATTHWLANDKSQKLDIWFDTKTGLPVKMGFNSQDGNLFVFEAKRL